MIEININGDLQRLQPNTSLAQVLVLKQIEPKSVALVVNQQIIPRSEWHQYQCQADDEIEFFSAVAGG